MNKNRLEGLSDAVFAIVMTILVIDFRLPENSATLTLLEEIQHFTPIFFAYVISFIVLDMFWISHNALFNIFTKNVNRLMIQLNMAYLALMALVPFSAHILGTHIASESAIVLYGFHIFLLGSVNYAMLRYALISDEIDTAHVSPRTVTTATIRMTLTPIMTAIGMAVAYFSLTLTFFFYAFPILFNIIPGGLDWIEKRFGLDFGERE
ncbi:MAG: TMEM175 family protein [Candidatus Latescibacterota bacterium]|jgi:uncharacterized membrane protein